MRTRSIWTFGLSAALFTLTFAGPAHAQRGNNVGQQIERQLLNSAGSAITGQPNYPYPNQPYGAYPGGYAQPGFQPQYGPGYYPPGAPGYQQPYRPGYFPQQQPQPGYFPPQQPQQPAAAAQRYQFPAQYAGAAPGSAVSYGGANYVVNADGTMSPGGAGAPAAAPVPPPADAQRYQIPAQFAGSAAGSVVSYGGASYVLNTDGTMSPYTGPVAR